MVLSDDSKASESVAKISIGGKLAVVVFVCALLAYVIESELTQYAQTTLSYRQPFFIFYVVHSAFTIIFPLHLFFLSVTTGQSTRSLLRGLSVAISNHLAPERQLNGVGFPIARFLRLTLALTAGISLPAVLWFISVSLSPLTDVIAIVNTNAFWCYVISVKLFKLEWQPKRLLAVVCATLGTLAVIYGGAKADKSLPEPSSRNPAGVPHQPSTRLIGTLCILVAAFSSGLYQVLYKIYIALPADPELSLDPRHIYDRIPDEETDLHSETESREPHSTSLLPTPRVQVIGDVVYPPPFGLHPNFITSVLGFFTFTILWIPLVALHWTGVERFRVPPDGITWLVLGAISVCGVTFNGGIMVLLGVWGPIIVSVGNLLTIVLVLCFDVFFRSGLQVLTRWSLLGAGSIVLAFGVLSYDMFTNDAT